ncbi:MAG: FAD-dependent oxidoreductase [Candidatus Nucleicultricaceae bacterium]
MKLKSLILLSSCTAVFGLSDLYASATIRDLNEPIGIIGSGPAGAYAARKFKDAGYTNITVLEGADHVGGKCFSYVAPDGEDYDLGAVQTASDYDIVNGLVTRFGLHQIPASAGVYIDQSGSHPSLPSQYSFARRLLAFSTYALYGTLYSSGTASYRNVGASPVLSQDLESYLSTYTLAPMKEFMNVALRIYGYGTYNSQNLSDVLVGHAYNYITPRLATDIMTSQIPLLNMTLSRPPLMSIQEGYQELIVRMTSDIHVETNKMVSRIQQGENGLSVQCQDGSQFNFSRVIVASPPRSIDFTDVLGVDPTSIFNKIHYNSYGTTLFKTPTDVINGIQFNLNFTGTEPGGILEKYPTTTHYISYAYKNANDDPSVVVPPLENFVETQFGATPEIVDQNYTDYYPHTSIADAPTYYANFEGLQGNGGVYFTGSHLSFENVEQAMRHAGEVVDQYFLGTQPAPTLTQRAWNATLGRFFS